MTASPETVSALTVLSAFLIASLSVLIVIYRLQWDYFNSKGTGQEIQMRVRLKDEARNRTLSVFVAETAYVLMAFAALVVNVLALYGGVPSDSAVLFSFSCLALFLLLVLEELSTSIRHVYNRVYVGAEPDRPSAMADWASRIWQSLTKSPEVSRNALWPLLMTAALFVVAWQVHQFQTDYLVQHSYSDDAKNMTALTSVPVWEESEKIWVGVVVGAVLSAPIVLGTRVGQRRSDRPPTDLHLVWNRAWLWTSVVVFIAWAVVRFAVSESLGGGIDGRIAEPWDAALKLFGHPGFSLLAVPLILEAKPRAVLFLGLGYGFHSLVNLIIGSLSWRPEFLIYSLTILFIVVFDLRMLFRWYPSMPTTLLRVLRRSIRSE